MGIVIWAAAGQVVLPVVAGGLFVAMSPRWPAAIAHPLATAFGLYVVLLILTALAAPGGDMWMPAIGGVVSIGVSIVALLILRRRKLAGRPGSTPSG